MQPNDAQSKSVSVESKKKRLLIKRESLRTLDAPELDLLNAVIGGTGNTGESDELYLY